MLVLIADNDPSFSAFVLQALESTDFEAHDVSDDTSLLAQAGGIVIAGGSFAARSLARPGTSVLVAVPDGDFAGLEAALENGAEDAFFKPIEPRALVARLTVARRRLIARRRPVTTWGAVEEALAARATGLVAIRGKEHSGAVHVHDGRISWVESTGRDVSLSALLARLGIEIDADTARAVLGEARETGKHFTQVAIDWGIAHAELVHECVRGYLSEVATELLGEAQATALFMPYDRSRASTLAFPPRDILDQSRPPMESGIVPTFSTQTRTVQHTVPTHALMALHGVSQLTGCQSTILMDRSGGRIAFTGEAIDNHFAWAIVHAMKGSQPSLTVEEDGIAHIARPLDEHRVLIGTFSLKDVNLGLARNSMIHCCNRALEGTLVLAKAAGFE